MKEKVRYCLTAFKNGLIDQNPTFVQVLGLCPTLATTTSVPNAVGMGLAATFVLTCSNALISLLRKFIPRQVRIAAYIVVIAGFVSIVEMLIKAYLPALDKSLGVFIPLIVVNCIILARAEAFASKNTVLPSVLDGLGMGLGFTIALTIIGAVREVLGNGTFCDISVFGESFKPIRMLIMPYGAFITLGILIAAVTKIRSLMPKKKAAASDEAAKEPAKADEQHEEPEPEEPKAEEKKPEEQKTEDPKPEETKPEETKPEDAKPEGSKSEETKSEETKSGDPKPGESGSGEGNPEGGKPEDNTSGPSDSGSGGGGKKKKHKKGKKPPQPDQGAGGNEESAAGNGGNDEGKEDDR